jgi:methylated-DNA-protein-cysteine methyltransferase-like protein
MRKAGNNEQKKPFQFLPSSFVLLSLRSSGSFEGRFMPRGRSREPRSAGLVRLKARVLAVLAAIPEDRVTTYGTIARHVKATARQVAFIMATLTMAESARLPWFRVVAANGVISSIKRGAVGRRQIERLRAEGIWVTPRNKVAEFKSVVWSPG